jgi:flagellar motor switch protein FliN/FliY
VITTPSELLTALLDELAAVVGALTGAVSQVIDAPRTESAEWLATLEAGGVLNGTCALAFEATAVEALSQMNASQAQPVSVVVVEAALRDALEQAIAALLGRRNAAGLTLQLNEIVADASVPAGDAEMVCAIMSPALPNPLSIRVWQALEEGAVGQAIPREEVESRQVSNSRIDVILDIDLPVVIRFGRTELPIRSLSRLGPGSIVDLGRSPDDPVEVLVSDRVIARGEVVVVGGNYGIRILDVVSPTERMRSLES